jgi:L-asparaginase II
VRASPYFLRQPYFVNQASHFDDASSRRSACKHLQALPLVPTDELTIKLFGMHHGTE